MADIDPGQAPTSEFVRYNAIGPFLDAKEINYADPAQNYFVLHHAGKFEKIGFRSFAMPSKPDWR